MNAGILAFAAMCLCACSAVGPRPVTAQSDGDASDSIPNEAIWRALAARDATSPVGAIESVKVIVHRRSDEVVFMQSRKWPMHIDYAVRFLLGPVPSQFTLSRWNEDNYQRDDREFVLGSLLHRAGSKVWTFELYAGDSLSVAATADVIDRVRAKVHFARDLVYRAVPAHHRTAVAKAELIARGITVVDSSDWFGSADNVAIELGESVGRLRFVDGATPEEQSKQLAALTTDDIVVLATTPIDLPAVAGVVSAEPIAPLSHIAVLAHGRNTPTVWKLGAAADAQWRSLAGQWVRLVADAQGGSLQPLSESEAALARKQLASRRKRVSLRRDDRFAKLASLAEIGSKGSIAAFGAKAVQLAKVASVTGSTPRAFVVPISCYLEFMRSAGVFTALAQAQRDPAFATDVAFRRETLSKIGAAIRAAPMSPSLLDAVANRIRTLLPNIASIRLRSSTNAEDLDGFSGAGLYTSVRIPANDQTALANGLRTVWASTWSYGAYEERALYNLDQNLVGMAVLVQESIDDEVATGVAISGNPFFQGRPGVFINAQLRDGSVTAAANQRPEQILRYTFERASAIERFSRSSLSPNTDLLSDPEVESLTRLIQRLHQAWFDEPIGGKHALDVEFLLRNVDGKRSIVFLQARPYPMRWSTGRATQR